MHPSNTVVDVPARRHLWKCYLVPQRYLLTLMGFLAILNAYTMRVCLSIAITEMVTKRIHASNASDFQTCQLLSDDLHITSDSQENSDFDNGSKMDTYEWSEEVQGLILSSFYWGYVLTHLPGGVLAEKFGGKYLLGLGILATAVLTLLIPIAVRFGNWPMLIALRVMQGLGEGTTFPALNVLLANWVPAAERSKLGTLAYSGAQIGTVIGNAVGGYLMQVYGHWSAVFYFFGGVAIVWFILWLILGYSTPESSPFISELELEYLKKTVRDNKSSEIKYKHRIPWRAILTSGPVIALIFAQIGHDWGFFIMITDLPKYMKDVLHFKTAKNGFLSAVPYLTMWVVSVSSACLCDWLIVKRVLHVTSARKIFTTIASIGPGLGMLMAVYSGCNRISAVTFFIVSMALMGTFFPGMKVNALDLSSHYAGTVMALVNGIGAITGIFAPYVVGVLTPNHSLMEWKIVFYITFFILAVTNIIFLIFASGEKQIWDKSKQSNNHLPTQNGCSSITH